MIRALTLALILWPVLAWASPSFSVLTNNSSTTNTTSYDTASVSPSANKPILLFVYHDIVDTATAQDVSASGNGLTWNVVAGRTFGTVKNLTVLCASGSSPSAGVITITINAGDADAIAWAVIEVSDSEPSCGSAVIQAPENDSGSAVVSHALTMAAFANSNNRPIGAFGRTSSGATSTIDGWTSLVDDSEATPGIRLNVQWVDSSADLEMSATWATSTTTGAIALEIAVPSTAIGIIGGGVGRFP